MNSLYCLVNRFYLKLISKTLVITIILSQQKSYIYEADVFLSFKVSVITGNVSVFLEYVHSLTLAAAAVCWSLRRCPASVAPGSRIASVRSPPFPLMSAVLSRAALSLSMYRFSRTVPFTQTRGKCVQ